MTKETRPIEMYYGYSYGGDSGSWETDYVDIPIDTPEEEIEQVAKEIAKNEYQGDDLAFVGVYHIVPLDEIDDFYCNF